MKWLTALNNWDMRAFLWLNGAGTPALDPLFLFLSSKYTWWVVAMIFTVFVAWKRDASLWKGWLLVLLCVGVADAVSFYGLKAYFERVRPCYLVPCRVIAAGCGSRFGFPSNHAANGMAVTVMSWLLSRSRWTLIVLFFTLVVGYSRVYLGVHYPLDVLGGFITGALLSSGLYLAARRWVR